MRALGETCLLAALVGSGYGAYLALTRQGDGSSLAARARAWCGLAVFAALSAAVALLGYGLVVKDFGLEYVAHYSSRGLPWHYSLAALWVGQAGSLLLWAWLLGLVTVLFRALTPAAAGVRETAYGLLLANVAFLTAILVFAADPFKASLGAVRHGLGLSPLLQHPSMLIHPPVTFLAYAIWSAPAALAAAALVHRQADLWPQLARRWALAAWAVLGTGLMLGANWAYEELGWGGYWGWDPVENGSLMPWLTGAALIHTLMVWRQGRGFRKTALALAFVTCALCNFASFLTRSGVFSSVHAFSESPIGWMFLGFLAVVLGGGAMLIVRGRESLGGGRAGGGILARENLVLVSIVLLLVLGVVVLAGTLVGPITTLALGRTVLVEAGLYNAAVVPVGLPLLALTAVVPLLDWGGNPAPVRRRALALAGVAAVAATAGFWLWQRPSLAVLGVVGLAVLGALCTVARLVQDARGRGVLEALRVGRRSYAGYTVHLGFLVLAVGVAGSSASSRRHEITMGPGDAVDWAGRTLRLVALEQHERGDILAAEAVLEVCGPGERRVVLRPARHLHRPQNEWTTEVAIDSTWAGDLYAIVHGGGEGKAALTFVENPLMRCLWLGGVIVVAGALAAAWPGRRQGAGVASEGRTVPTSDQEGKAARPRAA